MVPSLNYQSNYSVCVNSFGRISYYVYMCTQLSNRSSTSASTFLIFLPVCFATRDRWLNVGASFSCNVFHDHMPLMIRGIDPPRTGILCRKVDKGLSSFGCGREPIEYSTAPNLSQRRFGKGLVLTTHGSSSYTPQVFGTTHVESLTSNSISNVRCSLEGSQSTLVIALVIETGAFKNVKLCCCTMLDTGWVSLVVRQE
jgi:hypothetical protein